MAQAYPHAVFLRSAHTLAQAPPDRGVEVAFTGRSNAGKSSAINAITANRKLARTSKTPGRTRLLNFFDLGGARRLVDLPGYGYARAPEQLREHWKATLTAYFENRRSLRGLVLVMDSRHPMAPYDTQMVHWCHAAHLPVHVLLTKSDKLSRGRASATLVQVRRHLAEVDPTASAQLFSAKAGTGVESARAVLEEWFARSRSDSGGGGAAMRD